MTDPGAVPGVSPPPLAPPRPAPGTVPRAIRPRAGISVNRMQAGPVGLGVEAQPPGHRKA